MVQVRIFTTTNGGALECQVNEWLKENQHVEIIDIKIVAGTNGFKTGMIIYKNTNKSKK